MSDHQWKEVTCYVKVSRTTRWVRARGYHKGHKAKEELAIRAVKTLPSEKTRKWNDFYFPIKLKIPMFYTHESVELEVPPLPEGEVALELLKDQGE